MVGKEARILSDGLADMGLDLNGEQRRRLLDYVGLLARWNRVYNLTAVREPAKMMTRHILDCLTVVPHVWGERVLDVGTGPGLPGLVLAAVYPERRFVLLDSNGKKTRFCVQATADLGLGNVEVVQERIERYRNREPFTTIISRAYGSLANLLQTAGGLCAPDGRLLLMKGVYPHTELSEVAEQEECVKVLPLRVPGLDAERHLMIADMACITRSPGAAR